MDDITPIECDNTVPIIQYEIAFPKQTNLIGGGAANVANEQTRADISATLNDNIEWSTHIDEADKFDYIVAVSSGVLSGLIDAFFVGELSLNRAGEWGEKQINQIVMKAARSEGYGGDNLNDAIKSLEKNHPFAADGNTNDFGGGLQHHLRDFSHHFSLGGLFFSIFTQFTGLVVGTDKLGSLRVVPVPESHRACIGKNFQEKIAYGTIGWFFHMVSDMAGSSGSLMGGTGIPGPLVSFMKELSALPFFKDSNSSDMGFRLWVSKLFNGTYLADHDENGRIIKDTVKMFDLRMEIGLLGEIGRQAVPVLVNQCVVRGFYFCRRVFREIHDLNIRALADLDRIAPEDVLPWGTPAMRRMVTVSSGVFTGIDMADAAVRALLNKDPVTFLLRINYVGVATFVVSCVVDVRATLKDKALEEGESPEEAYERGLSQLDCLKLDCLKLDFSQARILHSLERAIVAYDITKEKKPKRAARKQEWLEEWSTKITETIGLVWATDAGYYLDDDAIFQAIEEQRASRTNDSWLWLIAMEAARFTAYAPLRGENDQAYKGLKLSTDYIRDVFCTRQSVVPEKELRKLDKTIDRTKTSLDGGVKKRVLGAVGTTVAAAGIGVLALYCAPAIAPALAAALGTPTASLYGAALTNASLAFLGGGALAAGGAGMAGGTVVIAGGGALLGTMGGTGLSAITSAVLASDSSYVLAECAKLVTFCEKVLIGQYNDAGSVLEIHRALSKRVVELEVEIEAIKRGASDSQAPENGGDANAEEKISPKKMIKILNRSCKFLKRSSDRLAKAMRAASEDKPALPPSTPDKTPES